MSEDKIRRISKFMSLVLRHDPGRIGLELDEQGWAATAALLERMNAAGVEIDQQLLEEVVATNIKKRFAFSSDKLMIRASQGHSINIDLKLVPAAPPAVLYHGTAQRFLESILKDGLQKMQRNHVHLSADMATAHAVGSRHGKPAILKVAADEMHEKGHTFFLSENNVWLAAYVSPEYLELL